MTYKNRLIRTLLILVLACSSIAVFVPVSGFAAFPDIFKRSEPENSQKIITPAPVAPVTGLPDFTTIVDRVSPAVVSIKVSGLKQTGMQNLPPWMDKNNPLYDFFQHFGFPENQAPSQPIEGQGSGFIIKADGHILTNAHVVENADNITVKLADNHEYEAKVIGIDHPSDIAIIKIDADDLPYIAVGNSDDLKVGEWVLAIGSPFGFDHTVSAGVVSAKSRSLSDGGAVPFIQTDVAINPGNSGGPLLNLKGEVVGINSQIYSQSGGYMGLSFAIPINYAMFIEQQLVDNGKVTRGRLGVMIQDVNQQLAEAFNMDKPRGALISKVEKDSPAEKAGLKSGDVILSVDGKEIGSSAEVARLITSHQPGTKAKLEILRQGDKKNITVAVDEMTNENVAFNGSDNSATPELGRLGAVVQDMDNDTRQKLNTDHGVLVQQVDGPAAKAGLQNGDVILAINSDKVDNTEDLKEKIDKAPDHIALLIKRGDNEIYVPVNLG